jgi:hypothetical protein
MHCWLVLPLFKNDLHDHALCVCAGIIVAVLYRGQYITNADFYNDLISAAIYVGGYLGAPGLIAEFIVRERQDKLRNLLTVMGCDFRAYWVGTFIADFLLMMIPLFVIFVAWAPGHMYDYSAGSGGAAFVIMILFTIHFISFAYLCSSMFTNPKYCIAVMPLFIIFLIIFPVIGILLQRRLSDRVIFDTQLVLVLLHLGKGQSHSHLLLRDLECQQAAVLTNQLGFREQAAHKQSQSGTLVRQCLAIA